MTLILLLLRLSFNFFITSYIMANSGSEAGAFPPPPSTQPASAAVEVAMSSGRGKARTAGEWEEEDRQTNSMLAD